jgi:hypothetical protein
VSTEILLTATLFGGVLLLALYAFDPRRRVALRRCAALVALGYLVAGVLASPLFYAAIWLPHPSGLVSAGGSPAPLSGVRTVIGAGGGSERAVVPVPPSAGISRVDVALLAIPLIAILVYLAWTKRAEPVARALTVTALIVLICSAGVVVIGSTSLPTPWALVQHLPLFGLVRPQRLTLFFWLIAAIGVGAWLAERPRSLIRWGIASAVVVSMLPPIWTGAWTSVIPTPPSLATAGLRQIALGDNLLVVAGPGGAISHRLDDLALPTVWQVRSNFSFRLADAYVGSFPPDLPPVVQRLVFRQEIDPSAAPALLAWLRRAGVTWVMVMRPTHAIEGRLRSVLRSEPIRIDGLDLYAVPAGTR